MINIVAEDNNFYSYDEETEYIVKNGTIVPSSDFEPIFTRDGKDEHGLPPVFIGILDKKGNKIISVNGKINKLTDNLNSII
jgi:hypothetical protein